MNVQQIRERLESYPEAGFQLNNQFKHDAYWQDDRCQAELRLVKHQKYLPALAALIADLNPKSLLTIGALYGTTESYLLQTWLNCFSHLREITICDVDLADYNPNRDNGSIIYRNICGTQYGNFQGVFTHIRGSSREPEAKLRLAACGPYDVVFVDGEHTAQAVYSDMSLAAESLRPGGTILVHDTALTSSSVPQGWHRWAGDHSPEWVCDSVTEETFLLGLGFAQRAADQ